MKHSTSKNQENPSRTGWVICNSTADFKAVLESLLLILQKGQNCRPFELCIIFGGQQMRFSRWRLEEAHRIWESKENRPVSLNLIKTIYVCSPNDTDWPDVFGCSCVSRRKVIETELRQLTETTKVRIMVFDFKTDITTFLFILKNASISRFWDRWWKVCEERFYSGIKRRFIR